MPTPLLIIHGGAGNITPENLPPEQWVIYRAKLHHVYLTAYAHLTKGNMSALDVATEAVKEMEDWEGWNCGKGAVSHVIGQWHE